jgi:hypothetical protein
MSRKILKKTYKKRHNIKIRDILTVASELAGIAGFLLALYIFIKEIL